LAFNKHVQYRVDASMLLRMTEKAAFGMPLSSLLQAGKCGF